VTQEQWQARHDAVAAMAPIALNVQRDNGSVFDSGENTKTAAINLVAVMEWKIKKESGGNG